MNAEASTPENWFVIDAPVSDAEKDAFGHDDIADNLHRMGTEPSKQRRVIGLFGEFGVGKSSIIQLLQAKLRGHKTLRVIRMSTERHVPVGFPLGRLAAPQYHCAPSARRQNSRESCSCAS